jgi:acetylornithine deacetylase
LQKTNAPALLFVIAGQNTEEVITVIDPLDAAVVSKTTQQLIRIPSINPTLAPEGEGESAIAAFAQAWMLEHGMRSWLEEPAPGRPNAVGECGNGNGPTLVLCAHLDTVSVSGMTIPPFDGFIEENRIYGRGACDMKGSVAAVLCAAASMARENFDGKLLVALVSDEEYASIGAQHFVEHHKADACILTESSEGKLILAHKGFVWVEIVTAGRAAHGSRWDLGESAVGKMGRIISALEDFDRNVLRKRRHPLVGPASQHCALIQGGTGISTYAERCSLQLERRTLPGEKTEEVLAELREVIAKTGEHADLRCILERPPLTCDRTQTIASLVREAARKVTGHLPEEAGVSYWMDAALFAAAGIPTVNYGPSGAGAHEAVEWVDIDSVVQCAAVLANTAKMFFAGKVE